MKIFEKIGAGYLVYFITEIATNRCRDRVLTELV